MTNEQLTALYEAKDAQATEQARMLYGEYCGGIARNILDTKEDCEECFTRVLEQMEDTVASVRPNDMKVYALRLTRTAACERIQMAYEKKRHRHRGYDVLAEWEDAVPAESAAACRETFDRFLKSLSKKTRMMFVKRYWFMHPLERIAADMDMAEDKLKARLLRTCRRLGEVLRDKESDGGDEGSSFLRFSEISDRYVKEAEKRRPFPWGRLLTVVAALSVAAVTFCLATGIWKVELPQPSVPHLCPVDEIEVASGNMVKQLVYRDVRYVYLSDGDVEKKQLGENLGAVLSDKPCEECKDRFEELRAESEEDIGGELYAVKGIDTAYLLWLKQGDEIELFAAKDMGNFRNGGALFSDRLYLRGTLQSVRFRQQGSGEAVDLSSKTAELDAFLKALDKAKPIENTDLQETDRLYVLQCRLLNGAELSLDLYVGGYVRWNAITFRVDDEAFDTLLYTMMSLV